MSTQITKIALNIEGRDANEATMIVAFYEVFVSSVIHHNLGLHMMIMLRYCIFSMETAICMTRNMIGKQF